MASRTPSRGTASGSRRASTGRLPEARRCRACVEAVVVVGEGTRDDELVEQDAVGVEPGRLDAGTHEHERAAPDELGQPRFHGRRLAGALEDDIDGALHDHARLGDARHHEVGRVQHGGGAHCLREISSARCRLGAAHVVDAERPERGDAQRPDGPRPQHEHPLASVDLALVDGRAARPRAARPAPRRGGRGRRGGRAARRPVPACRWRTRPAPGRCPACPAPHRATAVPATHIGQVPQRTVGPPTTTSPGRQLDTSEPTAATVPIHSWPCQLPGAPQPSSTMCRSLPQMPHSSMATRTSPAPTSGTGTDSTSSRPAAFSTAAGIVSGSSPTRWTVVDTACQVPARRDGGAVGEGGQREGGVVAGGGDEHRRVADEHVVDVPEPLLGRHHRAWPGRCPCGPCP